MIGIDADDEAVPGRRDRAQDAGDAPLAGTACDRESHEHHTGADANGDTRAITRGDIVTNWTVRNTGMVVPPTSDDYELWTIVQLRKECAQRKFRLGRKVTRSEQIRHLKDYDAAQRAV